MNTIFLLLGAYLTEVKSKYLAKRYQATNLRNKLKHKNQFCLKFAPYVTGILQATCYMQKGVLGITSYMWQKSYLFNNSSFEGLAIALAAAGAEAIMRLLP